MIILDWIKFIFGMDTKCIQFIPYICFQDSSTSPSLKLMMSTDNKYSYAREALCNRLSGMCFIIFSSWRCIYSKIIWRSTPTFLNILSFECLLRLNCNVFAIYIAFYYTLDNFIEPFIKIFYFRFADEFSILSHYCCFGIIIYSSNFEAVYLVNTFLQ